MGLFGSEKSEAEKFKESIRAQLKAITTVLQGAQKHADNGQGFSDSDYQVMVRNIEYASQQAILKLNPVTKNPMKQKMAGITDTGRNLCESLNRDLQDLWDRIGKHENYRTIPDIISQVLNMLAKIDHSINSKSRGEIYRIDTAYIDRILAMLTV